MFNEDGEDLPNDTGSHDGYRCSQLSRIKQIQFQFKRTGTFRCLTQTDG